MATTATPRRPSPCRPAPSRKTRISAPTSASPRPRYSNRVTSIAGSNPTAAIAPITRQAIPTTHSRIEAEERLRRHRRHHAEHRGLHGHQHGGTGREDVLVGPGRQQPEPQRERSEDHRPAAGAGRQRPRVRRRRSSPIRRSPASRGRPTPSRRRAVRSRRRPPGAPRPPAATAMLRRSATRCCSPRERAPQRRGWRDGTRAMSLASKTAVGERGVGTTRLRERRTVHLRGEDHRFAGVTRSGLGHDLTERVDHHRVAGVARRRLADRRDVDGVLDGTGGDQGPPVVDLARSRDPRRRDDDSSAPASTSRRVNSGNRRS